MKSFIATLILCSLMIVGVIANAIYVNRLSSELLLRIENLPSTPSADSEPLAQAFLDFWLSHAEWIKFSAGFQATDRITEYALTILAAIETNDSYGYRSAMALIADAVDDLARHERFSFENLL